MYPSVLTTNDSVSMILEWIILPCVQLSVVGIDFDASETDGGPGMDDKAIRFTVCNQRPTSSQILNVHIMNHEFYVNVKSMARKWILITSECNFYVFKKINIMLKFTHYNK